MKKPALNNAGLQIGLKFFGSCLHCPSCLAGYFTWPQVALTHHAFRRWLYASQIATVKLLPFAHLEHCHQSQSQNWQFVIIKMSCFICQHDHPIRLTDSGETNKYSISNNLQPHMEQKYNECRLPELQELLQPQSFEPNLHLCHTRKAIRKKTYAS